MSSTPITEAYLLTIAGGLVAVLFGLLCALIGWLGSKALGKLDEVVLMLDKVSSELHNRITGIDKRLVRVETRCQFQHTLRRVDDPDVEEEPKDANQ